MGNTVSNPDLVTLEEFKDQVLGTTVFLLSKSINPQLEFKSKENCTCDNLPLPRIESNNLYEIALSYYNYLEHKGTDKDLDLQIEDYINKNILDSRENVTRFYKTLIERLAIKPKTETKNEQSKKTSEVQLSVKHEDTNPKFGTCLLSNNETVNKPISPSQEAHVDDVDADELEYEEFETLPET